MSLLSFVAFFAFFRVLVVFGWERLYWMRLCVKPLRMLHTHIHELRWDAILANRGGHVVILKVINTVIFVDHVCCQMHYSEIHKTDERSCHSFRRCLKTIVGEYLTNAI